MADSVADSLTVSQAARLINIPERTLQRWVSSGKIPSLPSPNGGRARLIPTEALAAWRNGGQPGGSVSVNGRHESDVSPTSSANGEPAADTLADNDGQPPMVPAETYRELLERHEAAIRRLGWVEAQAAQVKALASDNEALARERAEVEVRAQAAEQIAEELRRRLESEEQARQAVEAALQEERAKGFWRRVFGK